MKAILIAIVCILLFTLPAEGINWMHVTSTDNARFYVDIDSIKQAEKPIVEAWTKWVYNEPKIAKELNDYVAHVSTHREYNCEERKTRELEQSAYNKEHRVVAHNPYKMSWFDVPPKTALSELLELICQF